LIRNNSPSPRKKVLTSTFESATTPAAFLRTESQESRLSNGSARRPTPMRSAPSKKNASPSTGDVASSEHDADYNARSSSTKQILPPTGRIPSNIITRPTTGSSHHVVDSQRNGRRPQTSSRSRSPCGTGHLDSNSSTTPIPSNSHQKHQTERSNNNSTEYDQTPKARNQKYIKSPKNTEENKRQNSNTPNNKDFDFNIDTSIPSIISTDNELTNGVSPMNGRNISPVSFARMTTCSSSPTPSCNYSIDESENIENNDNSTSKLASIACGAALNIVGGVGSVVEKVVDDINNMSCKPRRNANGMYDEYSILQKSSFLTLDTYEKEQLLEELHQIQRMTSWDTHGTATTSGTTTTLNTIGTDDSSCSGDAVSGLGGVDDDGNLIPEEVVKAHQSRKERAEALFKSEKKQKKSSPKANKKPRKKVHFEYPPISSLKEYPRITEEERKALFFTEDELDQYDYDRRTNISDDVEVVAIHDSDHYSKKRSKSKEGRNSTDSSSAKISQETTDKNDNKIEESCSQEDEDKSGRGKANNNDTSEKGSTVKLKGVQIYLRQRSIK